MPITFPATQLPNDVVDPDFGGRPALEFGLPSWQWVNSVLKFLEAAYLTYQRAPWATIVAVSQSAAVAGDVAVFVAGATAPGGLYYLRKYTSGLVVPVFAGIFLEPVSVSARARIAIAGAIPPTITGLGVPAAAAVAGIDTTTGRVRVAQTGDPVVGKIDVQGQLILSGFGTPGL